MVIQRVERAEFVEVKDLPGSERATGGVWINWIMSYEGHSEDKDKVVNALGGKHGLIDSGLPALVFNCL